MAMQECEFKIEVTPCDKGEKKAVLAFFKDFKASGGFDQLDRIHDFSSRVMYQGFPGGGRYMVEPCPDAVAFVEKFRARFPGISYSAELRIDFTGGDSLPPDIYRWVSEDVEKREQAEAARRRSGSDYERNRIASQLNNPEIAEFCSWAGITPEDFVDPCVLCMEEAFEPLAEPADTESLVYWLLDYIEEREELFELPLLDCMMLCYLAIGQVGSRYEPDSKWRKRLDELTEEFGPFHSA